MKIKNIKHSGKFRKARIWSNKMLSKYATFFEGDICNISGWLDEDKEGKKYSDYFENKKNYYITNYGGWRGFSGTEGEIFLDLEKELPKELEKRFDVTFNHTTLEHIYDVKKAFENICKMTKDVSIIIVPFLQEAHISESYKDFWRFTPFVMERMYEENNFSLVVCEHNNEFNTATYLFCIAIRNDKLHNYKMFKKVKLDNNNPAGEWLGYDRDIKTKLEKYIVTKLDFIKREKK